MTLKRYLLSMAAAFAILFLATGASAKQPKYVFFFLGDGMAGPQIQAAEAYLTTVNGGDATAAADLLKPENRLNMSKMTVAGLQTTCDAHRLITDSAASATAFACGLKTLSGVIGMDETGTVRYKSIAHLAHESGMKVGILSSVSLNHATPAAYYASVPGRSDMNAIAAQMAGSGYEFFGGGGLARPDSPVDVWRLLDANGYKVLKDRESILSLKEIPRDRVVCINPWLQDASAMPYDIDRLNTGNTNLSLAEMTGVAVANLSGSQKKARRDDGFFIMVEGGKIDWACHANDARAAVGDILDLDNAVGVALDFYRKHPLQTLIVVTGDHETGGMTIGHATTAYTADYDRLMNQKNSFQYFGDNEWKPHRAKTKGGICGGHLDADNLASDTVMLGWMETVFGLEWADLNEYQQEKLEDAYDQSMCGSNDNSSAENTYLYGDCNPIIVTITHVLNERAGIGWTSYSHTGVPVPVFAQGPEAHLFAGFYDNTDIARKLAKVMNLGDLPVKK
ncbi:alkaline phosphatase [Desulfococcus sp.]|uniref:alkaline phosphatase n=1 Tax=Desulfococcus sp. TaxID=2025834 RepID=UPI0035930F0C